MKIICPHCGDKTDPPLPVPAKVMCGECDLPFDPYEPMRRALQRRKSEHDAYCPNW